MGPIRQTPGAPRWGWSGGRFLEPPSGCSLELSASIQALGKTRSARHHLEARLLAMRAPYCRALAQDEFGPGRAEQRAALQELHGRTAKTRRIIGDFPEHLRTRVEGEFRRIELFQAPSWFDDSEIHAFALASSRVIKSDHSCLLIEDIRRLQQFTSSLNVLKVQLRLLDTNSQGTLLPWIRQMRLDLLDRARELNDSLEAFGGKLGRLESIFEKGIKALQGRRGPDRPKALTLLVRDLCIVFQRETGLPVASRSREEANFDAQADSASARFVEGVVEEFQPPADWLQSQPDHTSVQRIMRGSKADRARRIGNLMRLHVRLQPQADVRRRRPRKRVKP